ncbi:MAG: LysR family transcriptional regulator [Burkholderiales bacterium]|nr:LysR family transcriptional regulator [Burkholderiales bacterium]
MADFPHISLEQWRALQAVVEAGGYAQAAETLHKSQSAVTYAVQKIESQLDIKLFTLQGRKAVLTEAGQLLYRRARTLIDEALALERGVESLREGWKPEIRIAVEIIFPAHVMLDALRMYAAERPETHVELYETVMSGTHEMLVNGQVDLAICSTLPKGFIGDPLIDMRFIAAAHPGHPLHAVNRSLTQRDLKHHRHLYIRDTGTQRTRDPVLGGADDEPRWTVSDKATSIRAACMGLGYAWYAEEDIREELAAGLLKALPLREGAERFAQLYLVYADREYAGRDELRLGDIIRQRVAACPSVRERMTKTQSTGKQAIAGRSARRTRAKS